MLNFGGVLKLDCIAPYKLDFPPYKHWIRWKHHLSIKLQSSFCLILAFRKKMDFAKHAFWMESHTDLPQQSFWVASNSGHKARFVAVLQQVTCNQLYADLMIKLLCTSSNKQNNSCWMSQIIKILCSNSQISQIYNQDSNFWFIKPTLNFSWKSHGNLMAWKLQQAAQARNRPHG